jgi:hypothetical protein
MEVHIIPANIPAVKVSIEVAATVVDPTLFHNID